jgi:hypothetical protein
VIDKKFNNTSYEFTKSDLYRNTPQRAVIEKVLKALQESKAALNPYLQALTDVEKRALFKMGDKTIATVKKVYRLQNPFMKI